uniref:Acyl-CoA dehydrogenase n=1 Tax=Paramoeba aestuarina TaxID=180227 RepID=A0A7S4KPP5_9EUKA
MDSQYCEPSWTYSPSPYYDDSHRRVRAAMRKWMDEHIPEKKVVEWDHPLEYKVPASLPRAAGEAGILPTYVHGMNNGEILDPEKEMIGGVKVKDWTQFHTFVTLDELSRCGSAGVVWNLTGGLSIGLPPVAAYGTEALKKKTIHPCIMGEKRICLAITEPGAGSDVQNIQTTAKLSEDGTYYTVNGIKKWITNGVFADFFTTAVRTENGISLLCIERTEGVTTKPMEMMGGWGSGTTFVEFDDVKVPAENLIGEEGFGLMLIFMNFNLERWGTIVSAIRFARVCCAEATAFAKRRKVFGEYLIKNSAILQKIGNCVKRVEACQAWLDELTYHMIKTPENDQRWIGGALALLKAESTQTLEMCAREAAQVMGGISFTHGGAGSKVERIYREVRGFAIPAGSEEIMINLGVKEGMKRGRKLDSKL